MKGIDRMDIEDLEEECESCSLEYLYHNAPLDDPNEKRQSGLTTEE